MHRLIFAFAALLTLSATASADSCPTGVCPRPAPAKAVQVATYTRTVERSSVTVAVEARRGFRPLRAVGQRLFGRRRCG